MLTLVASAARIASGNSGVLALANFALVKAALFILDVTVAATAAGDTLDVYIQHTVDGTNWDDFVHFTQVLGNGGAKRFQAQWLRDLAPTSAQRALVDAALAAGVAHGPVGDQWRVKWVVATASAPSFTFSVGARLLLDRG